MEELSLMKFRYCGGPPVAYDHTQLISVQDGAVGILYSGAMNAHLAWQFGDANLCLGPQLFPVKAGQFVFGSSAAIARTRKLGAKIALRSDRSARMIMLPSNRLSELIVKDTASSEEILTAVNDWVSQLIRAVLPHAKKPNHAESLEATEAEGMLLKKMEAVSTRGLMWVRVPSGKAVVNDEVDLTLSSQCASRNLYFPIADSLWLRSSSDVTQIQVASSRQLLNDGLLWRSIENFNRRMLQHIRLQDQMPLSACAEQAFGWQNRRSV